MGNAKKVNTNNEAAAAPAVICNEETNSNSIQKDCHKSTGLSTTEEGVDIDVQRLTLADISEETLSSKDTLTKVCYVGLFLLKELNATETSRKETCAILEKYRELKNGNERIVTINDNTFSVYLSVIARKKISAIRCPGKKQGYYLVNINDTKSEPNITPSIDGSEISKTEKLWEKHLYPILTDYLSANDQLEWVINLANQRKNHEWGNTDILTLKIIEILGKEYFELTAYEVKLSMKSWRKDIFEAISHSLFSNKAYFTFVYVVDRDKIDPEMIIYAQKFNIGLLALEIEETDWNKIVQSPDQINGDMFELVEIVPAPYQVCDLNIQKAYFDKLCIRTSADLRNYKATNKSL